MAQAAGGGGGGGGWGGQAGAGRGWGRGGCSWAGGRRRGWRGGWGGGGGGGGAGAGLPGGSVRVPRRVASAAGARRARTVVAPVACRVRPVKENGSRICAGSSPVPAGPMVSRAACRA